MAEDCNSKTVSSLIRSKHVFTGGGWATYLEGFGPKFIKRFARRWFPLEYDAYNRRKWRAMDPCADAEEVSTYPAKVDVRLGIVREFAHAHKDYVSACRDMGVPYKILDLSGPDWIEVVRNCNCDAFLVRPSCELSVWKQMYDERLRVMVEDLGKIIYPTYDELWFYESKRRMCYWLQAHEIPHPDTWVFYDCDEAMEFARSTTLPIVFKTDFGSAASGVRIFRSRLRLMRWIKRCFRKGTIRKDEDPRDRSWGSVLLQEYLPDAREYRVSRLGDAYFGYEKLKKGDFHSGSHAWRYGRLSAELLDFARYVTDKGSFTSMALDVFITSSGRCLANELQSVFGVLAAQCVVDGKAGRMRWDSETSSWQFQEGPFADNKCCNLRVKTLLQQLNQAGKLVSSL
jgi:hypothetical protein